MEAELFLRVKPASELLQFEDWASNLEAMLNGPYNTAILNGELVLLEIKARVDSLRGMRIEIYPDEHAPPHFHVKSANVDASIRIEDCEILNGYVSSTDLDKIRIWFADGGKAKAIEMWNKMRPTDCVVGKYNR